MLNMNMNAEKIILPEIGNEKYLINNKIIFDKQNCIVEFADMIVVLIKN